MSEAQSDTAQAGGPAAGPTDAGDAGPSPVASVDGGGDAEAPPIPSEQAAPAMPKPPTAPAGQKFTFFVGPGNNSELVRQTFERRPWWELGKEDDPELNLKWLQVRSRPVAEAVRKAGRYFYIRAYARMNTYFNLGRGEYVPCRML